MPVKTLDKKEYFFRDKPILSSKDGFDIGTLLKIKPKFVLLANQDGNIFKVLPIKSIDDIPQEFFKPIDKAGYGLHLCDKNGQVYASMVYYDKIDFGKDLKYENVYFIEKATYATDWPD